MVSSWYFLSRRLAGRALMMRILSPRPVRTAQNNEPVLGLRVGGGWNGQRDGIAENGGRFLKADGGLGQIGSRLVRVPFKLSMAQVERGQGWTANKKTPSGRLVCSGSRTRLACGIFFSVHNSWTLCRKILHACRAHSGSALVFYPACSDWPCSSRWFKP